MDQTYFQKGFGLRSEIRPQLHENYRSQVVDVMRANGFRLEDTVCQDDVVLIPAFGMPAAEIDTLAGKGCVIVDTTCGSVLNVWKNVERYARASITSIIHGKYEHEEMEATFSRTTLFPGAHYLVVRDKNETAFVCDYIEKRGDRTEFLKRFQKAISGGFDPDVHLERIGLANQTTMLSSESLQIADMLQVAMNKRYGRKEMASKEEKELSILERYLPKQLSDGELQKIVEKEAAVLGATTKKDFGRLMKHLSEQLAGSVDNTFSSR